MLEVERAFSLEGIALEGGSQGNSTEGADFVSVKVRGIFSVGEGDKGGHQIG